MSTTVSVELSQYFEKNYADPHFKVRRRSAVINSAPNGPVLALCVVRAFWEETSHKTLESRSYPEARFVEDWLTKEECQTFLEALDAENVSIAGVSISRPSQPQWSINTVPLRNMFMERPGQVISTATEPRGLQFPQQPLVSLSAPYFPDACEAIRDWCQLTVYNGQSDGRNGSIIFLLPEERAYFSRMVSSREALTFEIAGRDAHTNAFLVKGAFWRQEKLTHFQCEITDRFGTAPIPDELNRLDCVLMDNSGTIYDYRQEQRGAHTGIPRERTPDGDETLSAKIFDHLRHGEGHSTEFKPFVCPQDPLGPSHNRTKLGQVVQTVVSFANAKGGQILLGIDDSCGLAGIEQQMQAWGKEALSDALSKRYAGALLNRLASEIHGDISLTVSCVKVTGKSIAVITVPEAQQKPVEFAGDSYLYVRTGASNRKLSPREWASAII